MADILVGEGDDDELHADPGDEQKSGELEFWTFVKELDEDRGGKRMSTTPQRPPMSTTRN